MTTGNIWGPGSSVRIGDADREAAVQALGEHYAAGRLTREEYDERADRAFAARTVAEVSGLFRDLPAPHPIGSAPRRAAAAVAAARPGAWPSNRPPARRQRVPFVPLLLLLIGLAMLLHAPWLVFLVLGALWLTRSSRRRGC
jgi:hypothetical protein